MQLIGGNEAAPDAAARPGPHGARVVRVYAGLGGAICANSSLVVSSVRPTPELGLLRCERMILTKHKEHKLQLFVPTDPNVDDVFSELSVPPHNILRVGPRQRRRVVHRAEREPVGRLEDVNTSLTALPGPLSHHLPLGVRRCRRILIVEHGPGGVRVVAPVQWPDLSEISVKYATVSQNIRQISLNLSQNFVPGYSRGCC